MKKVIGYFAIFAILAWLSLLKATDSVYGAYLVLGVASLFAFTYNRKNKISGTKPIIVLSIIFSSLVLLANYNIFRNFRIVEKAYGLVFLPIGGYFVFYSILTWLRSFALRFNWKNANLKCSTKKVFLLTFACLSIVYIATLLICCFPAVTTLDSYRQFHMIDTGVFSDHHPFYHTMLIKMIYSPVYAIFGNQNFAIFCFAAFQAIIMAAIFAYAIMTLYQLKINRKVVVIVAAVFAFLPCHLVFSFTVWKDVLFAGGILLFAVSSYRILNRVGNNNIIDYILAALGAASICLLRNNGFYVFIATAIIFFIIFRRTQLRLLAVFACVILISFVLKSLIPSFGVTPTESTEAYSIPLQQIARVVVDGGDISSEERDKIEKVISFDTIKREYINYISDPIKGAAWNEGGEYFAEHKMEYLALWFNLGIKNPKIYAKAWIDQTRGYWNGGYVYWNITLQNFYRSESEKPSFFNKALEYYVAFFNDFTLTRVLLSIGLYVWIGIFIVYLSIVRRDKSTAFLMVAPLGVIATLLIATPVYSEFRYAYSMFCCIPFVLPLLFVKRPRSKKAKQLK